MLEFNNLHIEGFASIKEFDINLNSKGINLIRGANGVGKSKLLHSIGWVLYGVTPTGISDVNTWKRYRDKHYQGTMVSLYFNNNGHIYRVVRCYNYTGKVEEVKGNSNLFFYKDSVLTTSKKKALIQNEIQTALGMSYTLFMNSIMFGQGLKRLIQESNTDQKKIFDEVFDMSFIHAAKDIAKVEFEKRQSQYLTLVNTRKNLLNSLEILQNTFEKAQKELKEFKKIKRENLREQRELKRLSTQRLNDFELKKPKSIEKNLLEIIDKKTKEAERLLKEAKSTRNGVSLEGLVDEIIELLENKKIKEALSKLKSLGQTFKSIEIYQKRFDDFRDQYNEARDSIHKLEMYNEKVKNLNQQIKTIDRRIKDIKNTKPTVLSEDISIKIENYKSKLEVLEKEIQLVSKETENYKWVYTEPLGNNGLKAYIFENSLQELNNILNEYSKVIGIGIWFLMDTSSTRKEFTTYIKMDGETVLYEELSGGQKQLVNLVMAFAMNELISYSKGINITFLDEVFENLSYDNIELVVSIIRKIFRDKTLFLITHHDSLPIGNSKVISVTRDKGISQYKF